MLPANYPLISEWLAFCDNHPQRSGEDFSNLASKFALEGFSRLHQLISNRITLEKLSEWFSIGKGMADLILRYAEEDVVAIRAEVFQMPLGASNIHGQDPMQH